MKDPVYDQLLFTVMSLYINLLAVDHPEVSSDKRGFLSCIFAIFTKALINADLEFNVNYNKKMIIIAN